MATVTEDTYRDYLSRLTAGDRRGCREIVEALLASQTDVRDLYGHLFQRSMYEVGEMWEFHKISVAVEHLATAITESLLNLVYPIIFAQEHCGKIGVESHVGEGSSFHFTLPLDAPVPETSR